MEKSQKYHISSVEHGCFGDDAMPEQNSWGECCDRPDEVENIFNEDAVPLEGLPLVLEKKDNPEQEKNTIKTNEIIYLAEQANRLANL